MTSLRKLKGGSSERSQRDDLVHKRLEIDIQVVNFVTVFANLQSFNQIWTLVSTARRNLAGNSSSRRSFALKIDLWQFIMFARALRHWTPMLSSPKKNNGDNCEHQKLLL